MSQSDLQQMNIFCCVLQVFFRAGVLGLMEEIREEKIAKILSWLQATARGKMSRVAYKKLQDQKVTRTCHKACR